MRSSLPLLLGLALVPGAVLGDTMTQSVPFDYDVNFGVSFPVIDGFDTLGGTRKLTGVTFDFHHNFTLDLFIESTGPTAVSAGDFAMDLAYITLFQLGEGGGEGDPPPPFFGPGAWFIAQITGNLGAYDGIPGNNGLDSLLLSYSDSFTVSQSYGLAEPDVLAAVTDVGPLTNVFGGFTEIFFQWINDPSWPPPANGFPEYPDDAAIWVSWPNFRHFGEIGVTYEYVTVLEPAGLAALAALGLLTIRRR